MGPIDDLARVRLLRAKPKKIPHQMPWLKGPAPLSQNFSALSLSVAQARARRRRSLEIFVCDGGL